MAFTVRSSSFSSFFEAVQIRSHNYFFSMCAVLFKLRQDILSFQSVFGLGECESLEYIQSLVAYLQLEVAYFDAVFFIVQRTTEDARGFSVGRSDTTLGLGVSLVRSATTPDFCVSPWSSNFTQYTRKHNLWEYSVLFPFFLF